MEPFWQICVDAPLRYPKAQCWSVVHVRWIRQFGKENGLSVYTPIIVKYRDTKTDAKTALEDAIAIKRQPATNTKNIKKQKKSHILLLLVVVFF